MSKDEESDSQKVTFYQFVIVRQIFMFCQLKIIAWVSKLGVIVSPSFTCIKAGCYYHPDSQMRTCSPQIAGGAGVKAAEIGGVGVVIKARGGAFSYPPLNHLYTFVWLANVVFSCGAFGSCMHFKYWLAWCRFQLMSLHKGEA